MEVTTAILLFLFALGGSFIQRVTGFGFGIFIMTALPFLLPSYGEATALSGLLAILCSAIPAITHFKYLKWKKLAVILPVFLALSFISVRLVGKIDAHSMKHVLGAVLIAVSVYFYFFSDKVRVKPGIGIQTAMGTISGIMGGLFAMQGPPAVIYFTSATDTKEEYIAISQWFFVIGNIVMTFFRAGNGFVTPTVGLDWLIGAPAVLLGLYLGAKVNRHLPIDTMRRCVYGYMAISGILAIIL